ncbi:arsenate-mycothiol transferase ArsC [Millisia brevis]|uniref:arsenate-mycothiol transferase ArsC n=1 Tax=Millisia brevis TaxID=264148 RepID=UPI000830B6CF|nr:low molecular weight phosphatase family protein [Millisia brevis]
MNEPSVLFICVSNRGKSVMAETLMRRRHGTLVVASSAGTNAALGGTVNDLSARVLEEIGAPVDAHEPRQVTDDLMVAADLVVIVGTAHLDAPPGVPVEVWAVDEPSERGIDGVARMRLIRDDIAARVDDLATRLHT